jgi:hypothetical protein
MSAKNGPKKAPVPPKIGDVSTLSLESHPAFGMWKDREDMKDPAAYVRKIRQPRYTWDDKLGVVRSEH